MNLNETTIHNNANENDNLLIAIVYCSAVLTLCMLGICCYCKCPQPRNNHIVPRP